MRTRMHVCPAFGHTFVRTMVRLRMFMWLSCAHVCMCAIASALAYARACVCALCSATPVHMMTVCVRISAPSYFPVLCLCLCVCVCACVCVRACICALSSATCVRTTVRLRHSTWLRCANVCASVRVLACARARQRMCAQWSVYGSLHGCIMHRHECARVHVRARTSVSACSVFRCICAHKGLSTDPYVPAHCERAYV